MDSIRAEHLLIRPAFTLSFRNIVKDRRPLFLSSQLILLPSLALVPQGAPGSYTQPVTALITLAPFTGQG